jgi:pimeloyl-ACP methyl ester carboxylesterase
VAAAHTLARELRAHEHYRFNPERFKGFNTPTLLLLGEHSPDFFKASIEVLSAKLPNNRVVVLSGQQHVAMDTAPQIFLQEVLGFLSASALR